MKLSLRQARRVEREIGAELDIDQTASHGRHGVTISVYENLVDKVDSIQKDSFEVLDKQTTLLRIRFAIRKAIETTNEVSGLNTFMNREAELKANVKLLTALMTPELTDEALNVASNRFNALKALIEAGTAPANHYGQTNDTITLQAVCKTDTLEKLRERAKLVQRELKQIEEKMGAINVGHQIEISDEDAKFLEQNNFVL